jgi:hypothetical protein
VVGSRWSSAAKSRLRSSGETQSRWCTAMEGGDGRAVRENEDGGARTNGLASGGGGRRRWRLPKPEGGGGGWGIESGVRVGVWLREEER